MTAAKSKVIALKPISHADAKGQLDLEVGDAVPLSRFKDDQLEALYRVGAIAETGEDPLSE